MVIVMRKEYTNTYKTKMVEKYKKSKMKISEFCRTNEIPTSTFNRWLLEDKMNLEKSSNFGEISTSLIKSAKLNNLNIYKYLNYLLDSLPQLDGIQTEENLERFLPWSDELLDDVRNFDGEYKEMELG